MPSVLRFSLAKKNNKWRVQKMGSLLDHNPGKCYDMVDGILKQKYIKIYDCNRLKGKMTAGLARQGRHSLTLSILRPIGGETTALDHLMLGIPFHKSNGHQWTSMDINGHSPCEIETLMLYYIVLYHVVYCTIILVLPCEHSIGYTVMYVVNPIINHPQFTRPYHVVVLHSITIPHKSFFFSMRGLP
jgi:hypothetical protein